MASSACQTFAKARQQFKRAPRIQENEWNNWRDLLVKLYIEDDKSREEVIGTMAKDHGFVITEVQFRHRLQKWDVKKYITESDMAIILALRKERQAIGQNPKFQYKGHDVDPERIEKASGRKRGPLPSTDFVPSYITIQPAKDQRLQTSGNCSSLSQSNDAVLDMPYDDGFLFMHPGLDATLSPTFGVGPALASNFSEPSIYQSLGPASQAPKGCNFAGFTQGRILQTSETEDCADFVSKTEIADLQDGSVRIRNDVADNNQQKPLSRVASPHTPELDWLAFVDLSPRTQSPVGVSNMSQDGHHPPAVQTPVVNGQDGFESQLGNDISFLQLNLSFYLLIVLYPDIQLRDLIVIAFSSQDAYPHILSRLDDFLRISHWIDTAEISNVLLTTSFGVRSRLGLELSLTKNGAEQLERDINWFRSRSEKLVHWSHEASATHVQQGQAAMSSQETYPNRFMGAERKIRSETEGGPEAVQKLSNEQDDQMKFIFVAVLLRVSPDSSYWSSSASNFHLLMTFWLLSEGAKRIE